MSLSALLAIVRGPTARATLRTSVVLVLRVVLQAATLLLVARLFGPDRFGAYAGLTALGVLLGAMSTFGTHFVLLAETSRSFKRRLRVLPYSVPTVLVTGGALLLLYALLVLLLPRSGIPAHALVVIAVTEILLMPLLTIPAVQLQATGRAARSQLLLVAPLLLRFLTIAALFVWPVDDVLVAYVYGSLGAALLGLAIATVSQQDPWPALRHWRFARRSELRRAAGFAALNITAAGPTELDKALAMRLLPLGHAGIYAAAARIIAAVTLPVTALVVAVLPKLLHSMGRHDRINRDMLLLLYASSLGYGVAIAVLVWLLAPLLTWLFGDAYADMRRALELLVFAIPAMTLRMTSGTLLVAADRPWIRVRFEIFGIVALAAAAVLLAPSQGLVGMATALLAAEWTMAFSGGWYVRQQKLHDPEPPRT